MGVKISGRRPKKIDDGEAHEKGGGWFGGLMQREFVVLL